MSKIVSEAFYGRREPPWLLERPKEQQSNFDQRGCVRQIKSVSHRRLTEHDLPTSRSRGSFFPEQQPSGTAADRQAVTVYNALPSVTHRAASNTSFSVPIVEFMVPLCCGKCEEKVKEELENDEGVYKVVCDLHNQRVTVSSTRDPNWLLRRIQRTKKNSHFWKGSSHFKDAHYLATSFPAASPPKSSHLHRHSQQLSQFQLQPIDRTVFPAYRESAPPHHSLPSRTQRQSQSQRYVTAAQRSPYVEDEDIDREYYYRPGADVDTQYRYKSSSPYETSYDHAPIYDTTVAYSFRDSHSHDDHIPSISSYGQSYATEDYALHCTGYY